MYQESDPSFDLERELGFSTTQMFGYSSDEDSEDDETIVETSQINLIKNLKSDTFDLAGPPIFNPRNQGVHLFAGNFNPPMLQKVNSNGGLFNSSQPQNQSYQMKTTPA